MNGPVARVAGHFGEWLQGRIGPGGPVALVTLACDALAVRARIIGESGFALEQAPEVLRPEIAARMLEALGLPARGRFRIEADIAPGAGAGMSTAALLALAGAAGSGTPLTPERLARACVAAEGASDPLMLPHPDRHLWASREGRALDPLPALPGFDILGGFWGPGQRTDAADHGFPDIADLIAPWQRAAAASDRAVIARLASLSAERTTALRGPGDDPTADLAARLRALGHARAHTGSARALIFAPGTVPAGAAEAARAAGLAGVFRFSSGGGA